MAVSQNELASDFSNQVKSLQPRMPKLTCDTERQQLGEEFFSEFSPTECILLKNFDFSESDITDSELRHFLRTLVGNNDVFSKFTYYVGEITRKFHVKLKRCWITEATTFQGSFALQGSTRNPPKWTATSRNYSWNGKWSWNGFVTHQSYHHSTQRRYCQIGDWRSISTP